MILDIFFVAVRDQVIKMLILVVVLFLICWGSRIILEIFIKYGLENFSQEIYKTRVAINLLPYIHSCINPFIYTLMSKNFRRSALRRWQRLSAACCTLACYCCRQHQAAAGLRRCSCSHNNPSSSMHEQSASSPCRACSHGPRDYQYGLQVVVRTTCNGRRPSASACYATTSLVADPASPNVALLRKHVHLHEPTEMESCFSAV